jgi:hypothetical protein
VSVLLGRGDGTFQAARNYAAGGVHPNSVAVGDFDADGHLDLAVANSGPPGTVSVLLGKGDGTFQGARSYTADSYPTTLAVADFNRDGKLDLATDSGVLLGNGDGTFRAPMTHGGNYGPVAVGDFNGDGIPDLAAADFFDFGGNGRGVRVLLGNGDGTFQPAQGYAAGFRPFAVAVGDFNGDGHPDLAVANIGDGTVSVLLGKGEGTFQAAHNYTAGSSPTSVAVGDFNSDGRPDLAVADVGDIYGNGGGVSVLLGNGDGAFGASHSYESAGFRPVSVAVGDFDGDGHLDLAVANHGYPGYGIPATVSVLLGKGDGTFHAAQSYAVGFLLSSVAVGDFDGDGHLDLAVTGYDYDGNSTVSILSGKGDGTFQDARSYAAGYRPESVAVGDFNGDGRLDLAVADVGDIYGNRGDVRVLLGNGDGTFQPVRSYAAGNSPSSVAVGDFNGDGDLDLAVANRGTYDRPGHTVSILLGKGDGTFQAAQDYAVGTFPVSVAVGDFDGDGHLDLAVANHGVYVHPNDSDPGNVSVLLGKGDGTFQAGQSYFVGPRSSSVAVGDFSSDGFPDVALTNLKSSTVTLLLNAADWGGRSAPAPPRRLARHRPVPSQSQMEPVSALLAASETPTRHALSLTVTDLRPSPVRQGPVETKTSRRVLPEATFTARPILATRHAQDAVFERWGDTVLDVLAMNL